MHGILRGGNTTIITGGRTDSIARPEIQRVVVELPDPVRVDPVTPRPTYAPLRTPPPNVTPAPPIIRTRPTPAPPVIRTQYNPNIITRVNKETLIIRPNGTMFISNRTRVVDSRNVDSRTRVVDTSVRGRGGTVVVGTIGGTSRDRSRVVDAGGVGRVSVPADDREIVVVQGFQANVIRKQNTRAPG